MKQIKEVIDDLGGIYEVAGAVITGIGMCFAVILASAIWG